LVIEGCAVVTVDAARTRYDVGHVVVQDGVITAVGPGRAPDEPDMPEGARRVDGSNCVLTPLGRTVLNLTRVFVKAGAEMNSPVISSVSIFISLTLLPRS
jgi:hypothetical protein